MQLKAAYMFVEQLYAGTLCTIRHVTGLKETPKLIKDVLNQLSTPPKQIDELKKSAARKTIMLALTRAKAYTDDIELAELSDGFLEFNTDGTVFSQEDYARLMKETRVIATKLTGELDLKRYQAAYDNGGNRITPAGYVPVSLIPARRKNTFAPDVDPSTLIEEDAEFEALSTIDWDVDNVQITRRAEPAQDDPEAEVMPKQGAEPAKKSAAGASSSAPQ